MIIDLKKIFNISKEEESKYSQALLKAIKGNAQEDFDYLKFKQSTLAMADLNIDEETGVKSAFATAMTIGATKANLLRSGQHYMNVLNKEKIQFAEAMGKQLDERVAQKKAEAENFIAKKQEYLNKIAKMQQEIELFEEKLQSVDNEISTAKEKIENTRKNFMETYDKFVETIDKDIALMNKYL